MPSMANFRSLIVITAFLAVIVLCISTMAAESPELFTTPTDQGPQAAHTTPTEMLSWNVTDAFVLNSTHSSEDYPVPDWHQTYWFEHTSSGAWYIAADTYDLWGGFWASNYERLAWYNETTGYKVGTNIGSEVMLLSTIEAAYGTTTNGTHNLSYRLTNSKGSLHIVLDWNDTAYGNNLTAVYYGSGIHFTLMQNWSDRVTSLNLLDILAGLFLGDLFGKNTLGIDPLYSKILTIVLDAAGVIMITTFVRSFIIWTGQD